MCAIHLHLKISAGKYRFELILQKNLHSSTATPCNHLVFLPSPQFLGQTEKRMYWQPQPHGFDNDIFQKFIECHGIYVLHIYD